MDWDFSTRGTLLPSSRLGNWREFKIEIVLLLFGEGLGEIPHGVLHSQFHLHIAADVAYGHHIREVLNHRIFGKLI